MSTAYTKGVASWLLHHDSPVWTLNAERSGHLWDHRRRTAEWRAAFTWLAKEAKIPNLTRVRIVARPFQRMGRLQDVGACIPAVKAAIDGIVDAGVLPDDGPEHVLELCFLQPGRGEGGLDLRIENLDSTSA